MSKKSVKITELLPLNNANKFRGSKIVGKKNVVPNLRGVVYRTSSPLSSFSYPWVLYFSVLRSSKFMVAVSVFAMGIMEDMAWVGNKRMAKTIKMLFCVECGLNSDAMRVLGITDFHVQRMLCAKGYFTSDYVLSSKGELVLSQIKAFCESKVSDTWVKVCDAQNFGIDKKK